MDNKKLLCDLVSQETYEVSGADIITFYLRGKLRPRVDFL